MYTHSNNMFQSCVQLHVAVVFDGAAEELCGDAGAGAGLQGLPGHWLLSGEGRNSAYNRTLL